ncbi:replication stress response regulator SDE2-like [Cucurbita pepo subsp. pepo]|uniref:replication stress response regulator SDE2-like n=1 Tax=Cucurbita pepo subsp. pepo TaxID=3664 RepID=UPI000C9D637C|nr:replication stress response regulator SDE2-like [Cucurbita pepo subsp. pepo]
MEAAAATDIPRSGSGRIFNLFVRLLDGKTLALKLTSPSVHGHAIKHRLFETTGIPPNHQRLVTGVRQIEDDSVVSCFDECSGKFPTVHLLLRLLGGKGGFGSLLRGAATKAGQKKTNNFDACRDMSGRRLRHVNAEKRLEEWKAEEEERRLEKVAEEFLKKKSKVGKKGVGDSATQKYVERYREESARCVAEVEKSVRDAVMKGGKGKRKGRSMPNGADAKKLKIWMGKRKMGESDSDDLDSDDSDSEEENEKSVILNDDCQSDLNKDAEGSSDSVNFGKHGYGSGEASSESGSEEEKNVAVQETMELVGSSSEKALCSEQFDEVEINDQTTQGAVVRSSEAEAVAVAVSADQEDEAVEQGAHGVEITNIEDVAANPQDISVPNNGEIVEDLSSLPEPNGSPVSKLSDRKETSASKINSSAPLNFEDFSSAADMEVLGLERLKSELQARGLKCGGTLQERAARLFLLKSTPLDKVPKKLLAKK